MKILLKNFFLISFFFVTSLSFAQNTNSKALSDKEIAIFLDALQQEAIISEFGKDALIKGFKKEGFRLPTNQIPMGLNKTIGFLNDSTMKSRAIILGALGVFEIIRNVGSAADELVQYRELSEKMLGEAMLFKPEIEAEISINKPETFLGLEFDIRQVKNNYLNLSAKLLKIGLIDKKVHDESIAWLQKDKIKLLKDFGFLIYMARQTYFYDNYESLKKQQISFIDSLKTVKIINELQANNLISSYKPFELKSKIEILSQCNLAFQIPVEQGNFTRAELYENLFSQIKKKLLPDLSFTDFKVTELVKPKIEENFDTQLNPLSRFRSFDKNKQLFDISLKINNLAYLQKANTDFGFMKKLKKEIPPDVNIDSTLIDTYANVFSSFLGFTNKDLQAINDYLTDIHSEKRVFILGNDFNPFSPSKVNAKMVMLLDSNQYKVFAKRDFSLLLSNQLNKSNIFSNEKSRDSLRAFVEELQKNLILSKINADSIDNRIVKHRYRASESDFFVRFRQSQKKDFLLSFSEIITQKDINQRTIRDFKYFMKELSRISDGKFNPENVFDNYATELEKSLQKDKKFKHSFKFNNKLYEEVKEIEKSLSEDEFTGSIPYLEEWTALANKALDDSKIDMKFYPINPPETYNYILLSKSQLDFINIKYPEIFRKPYVPTDVYVNYQNTVALFDAKIFADSLKANKMISFESFEQLQKEVDLKKVKQPSVVLKYSKDAFLVNINDLANKDNSLIYRELVDKIGQHILKDTKFSDIKITKQDSTEDYQTYIASAKINGQLYEQKLYVSLQNEMQKALDSLKNEKAQYFPSIGENQFKIINDFLTDSKNPKRLVIVCDYRSPMLSFVFFDSTQAHIVAETLPNNYVNYEMYNQSYSKDSLKIKLSAIEEIGLVDKLSESKKDSIITKFRQELLPFGRILQNTDNLLAESPYNEIEDFDENLLFKKLLANLQKIGKNKVVFVEMKDNFTKMNKKGIRSDRSYQYEFSLNGKKYSDFQLVKGKSKKIETEDYTNGYFMFDEDKVLHLINQALNEQSIDGNYHAITFFREEDMDEMTTQYMFLNGRQYRFLKEKYPEIFVEFYKERNLEIDEIEEKDK